ncbi:hypothetical protein [Streptacidiphilus sp. MAP5-3]|uniref:mechanosensitive ion channel family protein n=1 Tax=unclassified Streptacidiphilus TaxID=2643834 RepID=UPI0035177E07
MDIGGGISNAWSKFAAFVPKFIAFLAILIVGWIVARFIAKVLDRLLRRVGSERVAERAGIGRPLQGSSYAMTGILAKIVYYAIMLMALQLAFGVFGHNPISVMINAIVSWLPKGIVAVVIVVIANAVRDIVGNALANASYGKVSAQSSALSHPRSAAPGQSPSAAARNVRSSSSDIPAASSGRRRSVALPWSSSG